MAGALTKSPNRGQPQGWMQKILYYRKMLECWHFDKDVQDFYMFFSGLSSEPVLIMMPGDGGAFATIDNSIQTIVVIII